MRINKFIADNTSLSRRNADKAISNGRVKVNDRVAQIGDSISVSDTVYIDGKILSSSRKKTTTILLNKPVGYVCSKNGQGSKTIYDLLPEEHQDLNIAGRLDKDSSGLVILTNNGVLLNELTHPSFSKEKIYEVVIDKELTADEIKKLKTGVNIGDNRLSKFKDLEKVAEKTYKVVLEEGRNRQIRRTFENIESCVISLHRNRLGTYDLNELQKKQYKIV